jgi:hypothetical protein
MSSFMALQWIKDRNPNWLKTEITKTDFNKATKNNRDRWVRKYALEIFKEEKRNRVTYYDYKKSGNIS